MGAASEPGVLIWRETATNATPHRIASTLHKPPSAEASAGKTSEATPKRMVTVAVVHAVRRQPDGLAAAMKEETLSLIHI